MLGPTPVLGPLVLRVKGRLPSYPLWLNMQTRKLKLLISTVRLYSICISCPAFPFLREKCAYLHLQHGNLLLVGGGGQEAVHLALQGVVHLYVNVVARRLLLLQRLHTMSASQ